MGRRNEGNRLAHKKKVDNKKRKEQEAELLRKQKIRSILQAKDENHQKED